MPETKRPLKVFLCHASADKPKVRELYRYLRRRAIKPWFDEMDLVGGQDWQVEIPKALSTSDAIIICLTKNSVDKEGYVQKEIKFALDKALEMPEGRIFLIPVRFEECDVPFALSRYQWVDLFDEAGYARMMRALKFRAAQLERATVQVLSKDAEEEKLALERAKREEQEREEAEIAAEEKAAQEKLEREETERARKEAERKAAEKAELEKAKREATEKARRERAERRTAQFAVIKESFAKSFNKIRLARYRAKPFLQIGGIIGIVFVLFWIGSWAMSQLPLFVPTATARSTLRPGVTITFTISPAALTSTQRPNSTPTKTRTPAPTTLPNQITNSKGAEMVLVPAGEFMMGSDTERWGGGNLAHKVSLDAYYIDKYEVTNASYKTCVDEGICSPPYNTRSNTRNTYYGNPEFDNYPVIYVDWNMARKYCEWRDARLPTEAEWEKAARGDRDERVYPWSTELTALSCNYANYVDCVGDTTEVGSYESGISPYGAYDMAGNVEEWVEDELFGGYRILRGGSWASMYIFVPLRVLVFEAGSPKSPNTVGFRCAYPAP